MYIDADRGFRSRGLESSRQLELESDKTKVEAADGCEAKVEAGDACVSEKAGPCCLSSQAPVQACDRLTERIGRARLIQLIGSAMLKQLG
jgi:hypothetical protein